jgi:hypothetical protein
MSSAEGKKAAAHSGNYQDNITTPLSRNHDNNAISDHTDDDPDGIDMNLDLNTDGMLHQYFYDLLIDPCTGLYKPVQALKATS